MLRSSTEEKRKTGYVDAHVEALVLVKLAAKSESGQQNSGDERLASRVRRAALGRVCW